MNATSKLLKKLLKWLLPRLSLPLLVLNGWVLLLLLDYFHTPLNILITGSVLAFLLGYPVRWLERRGIKPLPAIIMILIGTLLVIGLLAVTIVPLLVKQAQSLTSNFSDWTNSFHKQVQILHDWVQEKGIPIDLDGVATNLSNHLATQLQALSGYLPKFLQGAVGSIFESFLIIVVTVYILLEGERLWIGILEWLPTSLRERLKTVLPRSFQNYFIGQGTIGLIEGTAMSLALTVFQIPYGFLFGIFIGVMVLVPFGGTIGITLVILLVSMKSIWLGLTVLVIALVIEQIVQNGIAPRLMGHLTGVHPVWVVMAILIGAKISGLLGVLLAVPLASTFKEIMEIYKPKRY